MAAFLATHIVQTPRGETAHPLDSVLLPRACRCSEKFGYSGQRRTCSPQKNTFTTEEHIHHRGHREHGGDLKRLTFVLSIINQRCLLYRRRADCEMPNHQIPPCLRGESSSARIS